MLADFKNIFNITTPYDLPELKRLLGDGSEYLTIGPFRRSGGLALGNEIISCLFKGIF